MINLPIPVINALKKLGQDINNARRRRRITVQLMAQRSGLSKSTINKIERGDPTSSLGSYGAVLFVLGMEKQLNSLADSMHDTIGRRLEDENLPQRVRIPKSKSEISDE